MLGYKEASEKTNRLPVFVSLSRMTPGTTLIQLILQSMKRLGLPNSTASLTRLLREGRLLLLLDGTDEVASRVYEVRREISALMSAFRSVQCFVTARDWAASSPNRNMCTVRLLPLTSRQLKSVLHNWSNEYPSHGKDVLEHLEANPHLYKVLSTPLLATLFCAIKLLGGRLPSSAIELYGERLRLLLHDWDAAKGLRRDRFTPDDKLFFLKKFAFELHSEVQRSASWNRVIGLIRRTIGEIADRTQAEDFARELIRHNSMLFQDLEGSWGLGHLQYQEYLTALELKENPRTGLAEYLGRGWWMSVIKMYAQTTRDIGRLIHDANKEYKDKVDGLRTDMELLEELSRLLKLAPNTEPEARGIVEPEWEMIEALEDSFDK